MEHLKFQPEKMSPVWLSASRSLQPAHSGGKDIAVDIRQMPTAMAVF